MLIILLPTVFLVLLTYLYVRWIRLKQYWAKRSVPYIPPHLLFGSLTFLLKENPAIWFRRMYDNFREPYVGIWIFWRIGLLINDPKIARNILIKDHAYFRNRLVSSGTTDPVGRLNLLTLDDPLWSVIRKQLTHLFTNSKLKGVQNLMIEKSKQLIERIEKDRQKPNPIGLRNLMADFTTDIIGTSSFGVVSDATLTGKSPLRNITEDFMKFSFFRGLSFCSAFFIPELADLFRFKIFPKDSITYMRKVLRTIIAQRGGFENKVTNPRDLLDILIKMKQEAGEELEMTEDIMLAQAALFLQAGFDTTAITLCFAIYELAYCPEAQEKLFRTIYLAKEKHGDNLLDSSVLSQLRYLNCVINGISSSVRPFTVHESIRKYPALSWLDRVATADYQFDDHLTIEAGTAIMVNVMGIHYDPVFYPEPNRFNPDRFLPENEDKIDASAFLPFGQGPRNCIGQRFGLSTVRHGLTAIILNYELRSFPNAPKPSEVKLAQKGVGVAPQDILSVESQSLCPQEVILIYLSQKLLALLYCDKHKNRIFL